MEYWCDDAAIMARGPLEEEEETRNSIPTSIAHGAT